MLGFLAGYLLIAYLLAPSVLFRLGFGISVPPNRIQKTRAEEITTAVFVTILPFLVTYIMLWFTPFGHLPSLTSDTRSASAHRWIMELALAGHPATGAKDGDYTNFFVDCSYQQLRFLFWFLSFVFAEGYLSGILVKRYANSGNESLRRKFIDRFLLSSVSEWHVLLTTFPLPKSDKRNSVEVDLLSNDGTLYNGRVLNWFQNKEGALTGLMMQNVSRTIRGNATASNCNPIEIWTDVRESKLYIPAASITNLNIRYAPKDDLTFGEQSIQSRKTEECVKQSLADMGIKVTVLPQKHSDQPEMPSGVPG